MSTFHYNGHDYNLVPANGNERNARGLDLAEVLNLLPTAIKAAATVAEQIKLIKNGQSAPVSVANSIDALLNLVTQAMTDADLTPAQLAAYQKVEKYINAATVAILTIEK